MKAFRDEIIDESSLISNVKKLHKFRLHFPTLVKDTNKSITSSASCEKLVYCLFSAMIQFVRSDVRMAGHDYRVSNFPDKPFHSTQIKVTILV